MSSVTTSTAASPARRIDDDVEAFHARHPAQADDRSGFWRIAIVIEVAIILVAWEVAISGLGLVRPTFMPPPTAIGASLVEIMARETFLDHLIFSLSNLVIGVVLAAAVGIPVGILVGWSRLLEVTVAPLLWALYSVPKVAFAPIVILALGLGHAPKIFLVFLLGVFPIMLNTIEGVRTIDPSLIAASRVFGTHRLGLARKVILPATLPYILIGLRRAVALGFIGAMLGEFLGGAKGIGHLLRRAAHDFHMDQALALVVVMVVVANIGLVIVDLGRRRFAPWSSS
jgi:ABC-type nitrate/sulfonate/bicarbonate transport system permease component